MEEDTSGTESGVQRATTTTISTIAVQSGETRIVVALLQSKEWMQLKVQEMQPSITDIGTCLEDTILLHRQHEQVLEKLQSKQSPVEELLRQADELISTQQPRAEVYAAMAENLGLAWKDLNNQLEQRRQILEQAVTFRSRVRDFTERMDRASLTYSDSYFPDDVDSCKMLLQRLHDDKKGILELSLQTLNAGQILVRGLDQIANNSLNDSRPRHLKIEAEKSSAAVEREMENLHDRWRYLETAWQNRKAKLELRLQILLVCNDLDQVENWLHTQGTEYSRQRSLGDSSASAEILLHEHGKVEAETKEVRDRSIRLLKTVERLSVSAEGPTETPKCRAYRCLSDCSDLMAAAHTRRQLLSLSVAFFDSCQTVTTRLDQLRLQLSTSELSPSAIDHIKRTVDDLVDPVVEEGHNLIEMAERLGTEGIQRKIAELEDGRRHLLQLCASLDTPESRTAYANFRNKYDTLYTWITGTIGAFLAGHTDMGSDYPAARNFLDDHRSVQRETTLKEVELSALLETVPSLVRVGGKEAEEVHEKADKLRQQWTLLLSVLERRISLARPYAAFHQLARQLGSDMDSVEAAVRSHLRTEEAPEKWLAVQQQFLELNNRGKNFIEDSHQVNDAHLQVERAISRVRSILDHFGNRKSQLTDLWNNWQRNVMAEKEESVHWEYYAKEIRRVIEVVTTFRLGLYPILPEEINQTDSMVVFLERHRDGIDDRIKSIGREMEECLEKSGEFSTKGESPYQRDQLILQMKNARNELEAKLSECRLLVTGMINFFQNLKGIEEKCRPQRPLATDPSSIDGRLEQHENLRATFLRLWQSTEREADQLMAKIKETEPPAAADRDREKIRTFRLLLGRRLEDDWKAEKDALEQEKFYWQLRQINRQIQESSEQLARMKGNTGESLSTVRLTRQAFVQLQKTIELLNDKVNTFVSTAERTVAPPLKEIEELRVKWSTFHTQIAETGSHVDLTLEYFTSIEQVEEWLKEASQLLVSVAQKSTHCKNPADAVNLRNEIDGFLTAGRARQEDRLKKLDTLSVRIHGTTSPVVQQMARKNRDTLESLERVGRDLEDLRQNLTEAEREKPKLYQEAAKEVQVNIEPDPTRPPVFTVPLIDVQVTEGSKVTFLCHVDGHPAPSIEWLKDGLPIRDNPDYQTKYENGLCTLTIEETFAEDSAKYVCRATNSVGGAETAGQLVVRESRPHQEAIPPHFVAEPQEAVVTAGRPAQLECRVEGNPLPVVSWFKNDVCIDNFPEYVITYNNGHSILRWERIGPEDQARYTCRAVNPAGQVASSAQLTVLPAEAFRKPEVVVPLSNVMARAGQKLRLECEIDGWPAPRVDWYRNRQPVSDFCQVDFSRGLATLVIAEAFPKDAGTYSLVASNQAGQVTCSCLVTVKGRLPLETSDSELASDLEPTKPDVRLHLQNGVVTEGSPIRLDCVIVGQPEPEVIWYHNGKPVKESEDVQLLFEGDRCSLIIKEAYLEDEGTYKCVAINSAGEASSVCELKVKPCQKVPSQEKSELEIGSPPMFSLMLRNVEAKEGESVKMACQVKGRPDPEIFWCRNGQKLSSSAHCQLTKESSGLTTLTIARVEKSDQGEYMVRATNNRGEAKCLATLSVSEKPGIPPTFLKYIDSLTVEKEKEAKFQCQITGWPQPQVQWYFGEILIKSDKFQSVACDGHHHSLTISKCLPFHSGRYTVKAENDSGRAVSSATLTVTEPEKSPGPAEMREQRAPIMVMSKKTTVVRKSTIHPPTELFSKGSYEILQTSEEETEDGTKDRQVEVSAPNPPTIQPPAAPPKFRQPLQSAVVKSGCRWGVEVEVTGRPEPRVEWFRDGVQLKNSPDFRISSEGNVHRLVIPEVFPDDSGNYRVTATNPSGQATSTADLIVEEESAETRRVAVVEEKKELYTKISLKKTEISETQEIGMIPEVRIWSGTKPVAYPAPRLVSLLKDIEPEGSPTTVEDGEESPVVPIVVEEKPKEKPKPIIKKEEKRTGKPKKEVIIEEDPVVGTRVEPPVFLQELSDVSVDQGDPVTLACRVGGWPVPTVKWYRQHQPITSSKDYQTVFKEGQCSLIIPQAYPQDQGDFTCVATNVAGSRSSSAKLVVRSPVFTSLRRYFQSKEEEAMLRRLNYHSLKTKEKKN